MDIQHHGQQKPVLDQTMFWYFSLKDEESVISAICWRSVVPRLKINLEDGIKVEIKLKVTTYSQQSKYQLIVQQIVFEGEGNLLKLLEQRKRRLAELGFFDESKKKEISEFPNSIGVITSESGAVIKDIIHRVSDRFPTKLLIYPSNVQGEKCLDDIIRGIEYFNIKKDNSQIANDKDNDYNGKLMFAFLGFIYLFTIFSFWEWGEVLLPRSASEPVSYTHLTLPTKA